MVFWHGCPEDAWEEIQAEGVLWGRRAVLNADGTVNNEYKQPSRCTYLAAKQEEARHYGTVLLRVEYEPGEGTDNYAEGCWQLRVYSPIPLAQVQRVED